MTQSAMSRDYDVILVMSQYSKSSHSETRAWINYPPGPFKHKLKENIMLKHERITSTTAKAEAFCATILRPKFSTCWWWKLAVRKVKPPLTIRVDV